MKIIDAELQLLDGNQSERAADETRKKLEEVALAAGYRLYRIVNDSVVYKGGTQIRQGIVKSTAPMVKVPALFRSYPRTAQLTNSQHIEIRGARQARQNELSEGFEPYISKMQRSVGGHILDKSVEVITTVQAFPSIVGELNILENGQVSPDNLAELARQSPRIAHQLKSVSHLALTKSISIPDISNNIPFVYISADDQQPTDLYFFDGSPISSGDDGYDQSLQRYTQINSQL